MKKSRESKKEKEVENYFELFQMTRPSTKKRKWPIRKWYKGQWRTTDEIEIMKTEERRQHWLRQIAICKKIIWETEERRRLEEEEAKKNCAKNEKNC